MGGNTFGLTDRDYAVLLLGDADLEAQLRAIRGQLHQHAQADAALQDDIKDLAERASKASGEYGMHLENSWVDEMHGSVFQDAAQSASAIGMLAPLLESLFVGIFGGIRDIEPPVRPVALAGTRATRASDPDFWDPHFVFSAKGKKSKDVLRGIVQLIETTGLAPRMPADYAQMLGAIFGYRNKMLHHGFEWPPAERTKFEATIGRQGWPSNWFDRSQTNGETWIIYMSDVLIRHTLTRIDEMLDGIGAFIQARYP
ncbi:hypothetical protein ACFQ1E_14205 [Sphingomonas canadensis]|uniref:RiboL-PSP-HEPN domain-containing protein n=1 Tax=Sphingomonas canadensis TaxID=1219257 RepID=A0ABW3H9X2_9SPHN|nr:hypothetical protein [Sphingomonas canadensis]MCW3837262.1 hypothetical protein [Sphingomonas canadensis]